MMYPARQDKIKEKELELEGIKANTSEDMYTVLEMHVNLDLEGYEDMDQEGEETGIKLPYIVTINESTNDILSIRRNYSAEDPLKKKN